MVKILLFCLYGVNHISAGCIYSIDCKGGHINLHAYCIIDMVEFCHLKTKSLSEVFVEIKCIKKDLELFFFT